MLEFCEIFLSLQNNFVKMNLNIEERVEILDLYSRNSARLAAALLNQRHPNRIRPLSHSTVIKIQNKFRATGSVANIMHVGRPRD